MQIKEICNDTPLTSLDLGVKALHPKLPKFDENKDDMDIFLENLKGSL